jgi:tetratricopeptide (TPR) repeat protein
MTPCARLLAVLAVTLVGGYDREVAMPLMASSAGSQATSAARVEAFPGQLAYQEAKGFVQRGDLRAAVNALQQAIAQNPEFTEAYYQLGAAKTNLAIEEVHRDEHAAIDLFREGVDAKKQARRLMSRNTYYVWNEWQRSQARIDLREALRDVDAVLADEPSLIAALKTYGGS